MSPVPFSNMELTSWRMGHSHESEGIAVHMRSTSSSHGYKLPWIFFYSVTTTPLTCLSQCALTLTSSSLACLESAIQKPAISSSLSSPTSFPLRHLSANTLAKDRSYYEGYDEDVKTYIVDEDKPLDEAEKENEDGEEQGGWLIDWHALQFASREMD